jgi:hypothetical protein
MRAKSEGDVSDPYARSAGADVVQGDVGPTCARENGLREKRSAAWASIQTLALPFALQLL